MSETSVKNEIGCRDDTMPNTVETRRHCEEGLEYATIFRNPLRFWGLRKIVACSKSSQCLLVSTVFGMVSSLHPISFLMIFTLV